MHSEEFLREAYTVSTIPIAVDTIKLLCKYKYGMHPNILFTDAKVFKYILQSFLRTDASFGHDFAQ